MWSQRQLRTRKGSLEQGPDMIRSWFWKEKMSPRGLGVKVEIVMVGPSPLGAL